MTIAGEVTWGRKTWSNEVTMFVAWEIQSAEDGSWAHIAWESIDEGTEWRLADLLREQFQPAIARALPGPDVPTDIPLIAEIVEHFRLENIDWQEVADSFLDEVRDLPKDRLCVVEERRRDEIENFYRE